MIFIGRSNSGKSSLINSIFKDKSIARKAKAPGTTKFLHFHKIAGSDTYIVDAPGYGFAQMNKRRRNLWFGLVESYIKISSRISQIFVCTIHVPSLSFGRDTKPRATSRSLKGAGSLN